jgi:uncharacterized repeat protein (TIGR03803 family)
MTAVLTTLTSFDNSADLFGTTFGAGNLSNDGTVFEIVNNGTAAAPSYASTPITLATFNGAEGLGPGASLIADANGDLFGTTRFGGSGNNGTVFEIVNNGTAAAPSYASTPTTLVNLADGALGLPFGSLITDAKGDLFGTTVFGGANNDGAVFEIVNNGTAAAPSYANTPITVVSWHQRSGSGVRLVG